MTSVAYRLLVLTVLATACAAPADPPGRSRIHLKVSGGSHAGRYAVTTDSAVCGDGEVLPGVVTVRYTDLRPGAAVTSLQLLGRPDGRFYLGFVLDGFRTDGTGHELDTRAEPTSGSGVLHIDRAATGLVIAAEGVTADSVPVRVTIECNGT